MFSKEAGYAYAQSIDMVLNRAARNHPVSDAESYEGYMTLIQAVRITLSVLETENNRHLPRCPTCGAPK